jgi:hypothetical protein
MKDFLNFKAMVTPSIVKVLYVLGAIGVVAAGVSLARTQVGRNDYDFNFLFFLGIVVVGELSWRVFCEIMILLFQIHDVLVRSNNPKQATAYTPASTPVSTYTSSPTLASESLYWTCSSCGTRNENASGAKYCNKCGDMR